MFPAAITPEIKLLLCCARMPLPLALMQDIQALVQLELNWTDLLQMATQHGVVPLLYNSLSHTCPDQVPPAIWSQLQQAFYTNTIKNLQLSSELIDLLQLFQDHSIAAIPFKGPVLGASLYGNLALRPAGDLDILVPAPEMSRAQAILQAHGYQQVDFLGWQVSFFHREREVLVELHQLLVAPGFTLPHPWEGLWERAQTVTLTDTSVPNLHPEDVLLLLCVNVARDCTERRGRLVQLCDIAMLLAQEPVIDYPRLIARAEQLGYQRMLWVGLQIVQDLFDTPLAPEACEAIQQDRQIPSLAKQVSTGLFVESQAPSPDQRFFYYHVCFYYRAFFYLRVRGIGPREIAAYLPKLIRQIMASGTRNGMPSTRSAGLSLLSALRQPGRALGSIYHGYQIGAEPFNSEGSGPEQ